MKTTKTLFSIISLLILLFCVNQNTISQSSLFSYKTYVSDKGDELPYRQLISDADPSSKYPLVIFLHGSGERGDDNEAQLKWGVHNFASDRILKSYRPIVIAPQCPSGQQWGNYWNNNSLLPQPTRSMQLLIELIDKLIQELPIDPSRIYITGLSMGGFGTFDAISRYPDKFAAAVPVCGGGDPTKAKVISTIPIWIFHGALDKTVKPELSQQMLEALTIEGANPGYTQYPEAGHFSWIAAYDDEMMMDWLFQQKRLE